MLNFSLIGYRLGENYLIEIDSTSLLFNLEPLMILFWILGFRTVSKVELPTL